MTGTYILWTTNLHLPERVLMSQESQNSRGLPSKSPLILKRGWPRTICRKQNKFTWGNLSSRSTEQNHAWVPVAAPPGVGPWHGLNVGAETRVAASFMRHLLHSQPFADPVLGRHQHHFCVDGIEEHIPLRQDEPGRHQAGEGQSHRNSRSVKTSLPDPRRPLPPTTPGVPKQFYCG